MGFANKVANGILILNIGFVEEQVGTICIYL